MKEATWANSQHIRSYNVMGFKAEHKIPQQKKKIIKNKTKKGLINWKKVFK